MNANKSLAELGTRLFSSSATALIIAFAARFIYIFFFFEASLILIFLIILGWGYQPERLLARIIIFFILWLLRFLF